MADVTSYVNKKTETDLPYFAGGLLVSGLLMTALPLALPRNNEVAQLIRTGTAGLATVQVAFAGCFWRRVHKKLIPHWQEIDTLIAEYQSKLLDLELSENFDKEMSQSVARTMAHASVTLEAEVKPMSQQQPSVITPNHQQLERMFWEGDDQVRNWMREKGLFNPEKRPEVPEDKDFSSSPSNSSSSESTENSLAKNQEEEPREESLKNGNKWNYPELYKQVGRLLVKGEVVEDAVKKVTGLSKGNGQQFYRLLQKCKEHFGIE